MLDYFYTNAFKKDIKTTKKRGLDTTPMKELMELIIEEKELDKKYKNHKLSGKWKGRFDCHIADDWLLIYKIKNRTVIFERTGTHQDIFE
jgi:mRNA interferase YafQ